MNERFRKFALVGIVATGFGSMAIADEFAPPEPRVLQVVPIPPIVNAIQVEPVVESNGQALQVEKQADVPESQLSDRAVVDESRASATETIRERYPDGSVKIERQVKQDTNLNYVRHGAWRYFSQDGNVIAEGVYDDGAMHGTWQRWHRGDQAELFQQAPYDQFSSPFLSEAQFSKGKLDGVWTIYDSKQRVVSEIPFKDGVRHGVASWRYPNGQKSRQISFRNGTVEGDLVRWDKEGKVTVRKTYTDGRLPSNQTVTYPDSNQTKSEVSYLSAKMVIDTLDDWWNASTASFAKRGEKVRHGKWVTYHKNGNEMSRGEHRFGQPTGDYVSWHSNGQKASQGQYLDGKQTGTWTWWHPNGQKYVQGDYTTGKAIGLWVWWEPTGAVARKKQMSKDVSVSRKPVDGKTL